VKDDCDTYDMKWSSGGIFTTMTLPASGETFLKALNDGSQYVEVVSLWLAVHQNFGKCTPTP
jgi:hypothetical protein